MKYLKHQLVERTEEQERLLEGALGSIGKALLGGNADLAIARARKNKREAGGYKGIARNVASSLAPKKVAATLSAKAKGLRSTPEVEPDTISTTSEPRWAGTTLLPGKTTTAPNPKAGKPTGQMVPGTLRKAATAVRVKAGQVAQSPAGYAVAGTKKILGGALKGVKGIPDAYRGYKGVADRLGKAFAHPAKRDEKGNVIKKRGRTERDTSKRTLKMKAANALGAVVAPFERNLRDFQQTGGTPSVAAPRGSGRSRRRRPEGEREEQQSANSSTGAREN